MKTSRVENYSEKDHKNSGLSDWLFKEPFISLTGVVFLFMILAISWMALAENLIIEQRELSIECCVICCWIMIMDLSSWLSLVAFLFHWLFDVEIKLQLLRVLGMGFVSSTFNGGHESGGSYSFTDGIIGMFFFSLFIIIAVSSRPPYSCFCCIWFRMADH